jgi:hypothetical protein
VQGERPIAVGTGIWEYTVHYYMYLVNLSFWPVRKIRELRCRSIRSRTGLRQVTNSQVGQWCREHLGVALQTQRKLAFAAEQIWDPKRLAMEPNILAVHVLCQGLFWAIGGRKKGENERGFGLTSQLFEREEEESRWPVGPIINLRLVPVPQGRVNLGPSAQKKPPIQSRRVAMCCPSRRLLASLRDVNELKSVTP